MRGWHMALALAWGCAVDPSGLAGLDGGRVGPGDARVDAPSPRDAHMDDVVVRPDAPSADAGASDAGAEDAGADAGVPDAGCSLPTPAGAYVATERAIAVDGEHVDWESELFVAIEDWDTVSLAPAPTAGNLSARFAVAWQPDALYIAVHVRDDVHSGHVGDSASAWTGDSVQVGFDVAANATPLAPYDLTDDFEYGVALGGDGTQLAHRWIAPIAQSPSSMRHRVMREGDRTRYELALRPEDLGLTSFEHGTHVRMGLIVNERDHGAREGWLEWGSGIGRTKEPALFRDLYLGAIPCP